MLKSDRSVFEKVLPVDDNEVDCPNFIASNWMEDNKINNRLESD